MRPEFSEIFPTPTRFLDSVIRRLLSYQPHLLPLFDTEGSRSQLKLISALKNVDHHQKNLHCWADLTLKQTDALLQKIVTKQPNTSIYMHTNNAQNANSSSFTLSRRQPSFFLPYLPRYNTPVLIIFRTRTRISV